MSRDEKIACGSYVYFTFLRPFAEIAGISDEIDWTCPRDTPEDLIDVIKDFPRQALHSYQLAFEDPDTKETISYCAPMHKDMQSLINKLKKHI